MTTRGARWGLIAIFLLPSLTLGYFAMALTGSSTPDDALELSRAVFSNDRAGRYLEATFTGEGFDESTRFALSLDAGNRAAVVGELQTWSSLQDVAVSGGYAYLANSYRGLQIVDIGSPDRPRIIGSLQTPGKVWDIEVRGKWAFASDTDTGLLIIDVEDPHDPRLVASVPTKRPMSLAIGDDHAYVADNTGRMLVVDIRHPDHPAVVASVEIGTPLLRIAVANGRAYLAAPSEGLLIYNLENPSGPYEEGRLLSSKGVTAVRVRSSTAYVTTVDNRFLTVDVHLPTLPRVVGEVGLPSRAVDLALAHDRAYLASSSGTLAIDLDDESRPRLLGRISAGNDRGLVVATDLAFIAGSRQGLKILDLKRGVLPQKLAGLDTDGKSQAVVVNGERAYLADGPAGIKVVDVSDPFHPRLLGALDTPGYAWSLAIDDDTAYVADGESGLQIIDVSHPAEMVTLGSFPSEMDALKVTLDGNRAYVLEGAKESRDNRISCIDVFEPHHPKPCGSYETSMPAKDLEASDGFVYLANIADGLHILKADGGRLRPVSTATMPWPQQHFAEALAVRIEEPFAYLANGRAGFQTIDISDPDQPHPVGNLSLSGHFRDIEQEGDRAYLFSRLSGLWVVDVEDASDPRRVAHLALPNSVEDITVAGKTLFAANGWSGLLILPLPTEDEWRRLRGPNEMEVVFSRPPMEGRYLVQAFNRGNSAQLDREFEFAPPEGRIGAVTVSVGD